ncbi:NADH-quinone oxidoreductase subunit L [Bacillus sp. AGMB 02131]|uniref:NADH-quinone oxidoreductase subunit L n=1 Tax=Peribacillus faecalis TaxID=2772559 RepID=A0A927D0V7_9BACI|nr:NADH-quinone oxidoreductase subunit L [Peribacillus faecalis]MBD3109495.1 NADH-quinone oxidoreductase subunit L [Peribacillus faecalis]
MANAWVIPLLPLLSFLLLLLFGKKLKEWSAYIAIALAFGSFVYSLLVLLERLSAPTYKAEANWLTIGDVSLTAGFEINQLNALMLVVVSLVSLLVQLYSVGYMRGDERQPVFYSYLGLFTFAMLGLVMSPNLLQLYIFWELVGVGSFLLIGFYFYKREAKKAAKKAFVMTRIGDVGLFIGMMLLFWEVGSFELDVIFTAVEYGTIPAGLLTVICLLLFVGAIGKSGQFPLHTWLPDAMEGPTPVSALIHAATMVAAGVYLVATTFPLFSASETAMYIVAIVGGFTAIFAASIALVQNDIKRVLAYSTISQLGYMMLALGSGGYVAGVFHLMTHAFFKALLFLAAGSVIHAVATQDIRKMGGLWKKIRWTGVLFLIGTMAISGVPFLSGFFSKDEILLAVRADGNIILFVIALITACLTAFYMFRLFFLVFAGQSRGETGAVHEAPKSMLLPMVILAGLAVLSGYVNTAWFGSYLGEWLVDGNAVLGQSHIEGPGWVMWSAVTMSVIGILIAYLMYVKKRISGNRLRGEQSMLYRLLSNKYYIDELYGRSVIPLTKGISAVLRFIDCYIVEGLMLLVKGIVLLFGKAGSALQNGQMQQYGTAAVVGLALLLAIYAITGGLL